MSRRPDRWGIYEKRIRDGVIFATGIAGVVNELWIIDAPRPSALLFLASLIGVPFVLGADERRADKDQDGSDG